jgi:predicted acetyltransferase
MLRLEFPNESHREMYENLIQELQKLWIELSHPDNIFAFKGQDYDTLLKNLRADKIGTREERVPSTAFFLIDTNREVLLWAIQIRHHIHHPNLIHRWGHIGYAIRPSERRKWYATKMLEFALIEARWIWIDTVLITCDVNNIGSNKVIQANGGVLEKKAKHKNGTYFNRYWITL